MNNGSETRQVWRFLAPAFESLGGAPDDKRRCARWILTLAIAMLAVACNGKDPSSPSSASPQASDPRFSIAYSALTTKVGDEVTLTAHLENETGAVEWSVSGPGALSAASGDEVSYRATAPGKADVVASVAGLTSSISIDVLPAPDSGGDGDTGGGSGSGSTSPSCTPIEVKGLILNQDGDPVVNQSVFVLGDPSTLTATDGEGRFAIQDVTPPYDLAMVVGHDYSVFVYRGLTRPDPTLFVFLQGDQTVLPPRTATISGNLSGGDAAATNDISFIGFGSAAVRMPWNLQRQSFSPDLLVVPGEYELTANWNGPGTTTGTLVALEMRVDPVTGAPLEYWYADQSDVTLLSPQTTLVGPDLMLMNVTGGNTQGTISLPPMYALTSKSVALSLEKDVFFPIYTDTLSLGQPNFKYIAPNINKAGTQVCAIAEDTVRALAKTTSITCIDALAPQTDDALLEILAAPQPFAPAYGANAVGVNTTFAWSPFKGGVHLAVIAPATKAVPSPTYYIFTKGTSTTVPDLSPLGWAFGPGIYSWAVTGFAPFASMDDFTADIPAPAVYLKSVEAQAAMTALARWIPPVPNASVGKGVYNNFSVPTP